jgi:hypothetical protein
MSMKAKRRRLHPVVAGRGKSRRVSYEHQSDELGVESVCRSTTAKLVLMKLADNADDSCCGFPSIALVARQCEINERTAQRTIRSLEAAGFLRVEARFRGRRRTSNAYYLNVPEASGGKLPPPVRTPPSSQASEPPLPPASRPGGGGADVTRTTTEPSNKEPPLQRGHRVSDHIALPASLSGAQSVKARVILSTLPTDQQQQVADEWAARLRRQSLHKPLAYLITLVQRANAGTFVPELAGEERARREREQRNNSSSSPSPPTVNQPSSAAQIQALVAVIGNTLRRGS